MKVQKNYCSACKYNFFTTSMFFAHRTGDYSYQTESHPKQPVGTSPRRCLTVEEMSLQGWVLRTLDVDVIVEGKRTKQAMSTWVMAWQLEAREAQSAHMKKINAPHRFKKR